MSPGCPPAQVRLDLLITLLLPEGSMDVAPHGLIGQTFDGSDGGVDGAVDPKPQLGEHMTTRAMAEGSIEGVWQDYVMPSPFATSFKFSRFGVTKAPPRNVTALTGRKFKYAPDASSTSAKASHDEGTWSHLVAASGRIWWRRATVRQPNCPYGLGHRTRAATKHNVLPQSTTSDFARRA